MKKIFNLLLLIVLLVSIVGFGSCKAKLTAEDIIINEYEEYIDKIVFEYNKLNDGDYSTIDNIAELLTHWNRNNEKIEALKLTKEQEERIQKINDKFLPN